MKNKKLIDAIGNIEDKYIEEAHESPRLHLSWALTGKILTLACSILLLVTIVPKFFNSNTKYSYDSADYEYATQESYYEAAAADYDGIENINSDSILTENKKLIVTGRLNLETLEFDKALEKLNTAINSYNGYIQSSTTYSYRNNSRTYEATIRIPAENYNDFLNSAKENANITYYNETIDDITDTYNDLSARIASLKAEEEVILDFYKKASSLSELMEVEQRLTEIRYEIDYLETSIKNYDLLVSYSTLNITITETKVYPENNDSFFTRLSLSFTNGFHNFINGIEELVLGFIYNIWTIVIIVVFLFISYCIYKKIRNRKK